MFSDFIADSEAWDMYITGAAGTGKTTSLAEYVQYCIDLGIPHIVCAYTHKACSILRSKLPAEARVQTLHSFLKKRPTINGDAVHRKHLESNTQTGAPDAEPKVMFLDEYSMIGESDFASIREHQDPDYEGAPNLKVVWIGDSNQLPPVKDQPAIIPDGMYQMKLTKVYRQAADNPLMKPLRQLVSYIDGVAKPAPLEANAKFHRGCNLVDTYHNLATNDAVLLCYTNKAVEYYNRQIANSSEPYPGDCLFSPTTKQHYTFNAWVEHPYQIDRAFGEVLCLNSKYKTLEWLQTMSNIRFASVYNEEGEEQIFATIFGHYQAKLTREEYSQEAVATNKAIEQEFPQYKASAWSRMNPKHKLARARSKAWRNFLAYDENVVVLDFPFAMTVHKSQGSTYDTVLVDTDDIALIAERDFNLYLKLLYVAISRASNEVYTC